MLKPLDSAVRHIGIRRSDEHISIRLKLAPFGFIPSISVFRSALAGVSLSDLILEELHALVILPSERELLDHLNEAEPFTMKVSSAKIIRKDRDAA